MSEVQVDITPEVQRLRQKVAAHLELNRPVNSDDVDLLMAAHERREETAKLHLTAQWRDIGVARARLVTVPSDAWQYGQERDRKTFRPFKNATQYHAASTVDEAWGHIHSDGIDAAQGLYIIPQVLRSDKLGLNRWAGKKHHGSVGDSDVERSGVVYVDIDAVKAADGMASEEEVWAAFEVAVKVYTDLVTRLESNNGVGFLFSGSGFQIWLFHDEVEASVAKKPRIQLLHSLATLFGDHPKRIDTSVSNLARLAPLAGTMKRKAQGEGRPHRSVAYWSNGSGERIPWDMFSEVVSQYEALAPAPQQVLNRSDRRIARTDTDGIFKAANSVPIGDVYSALGRLQRGSPQCPGCGDVKASAIKFDASRNCLHDFRPDCPKSDWTVLDTVMADLHVHVGGAYDWIAQRFGLPAREAPQEYEIAEDEGMTLDRETEPTVEVELTPAPEPECEAPKDDWKDKLIRDGKRVRGCTANVELYLTNHPRWLNRIGWDEFYHQVTWLSQPPWVEFYPETATVAAGQGWSDEDDTRLVSVLDRSRLHVGRKMVREVINLVAKRRQYHPVREYLEGLQWDGKERLTGWLNTYFGVEANEYSATVGAWTLIQAVRRIYEPGASAKYVLTLEGEQDIGKSTALKILFGAKWTADSAIDIASKEGAMSLKGVWCLELAEGSILGRAAITALKQFIGQPSDHYVPKFGNSPITAPRQVVFIMTVNDHQYLIDHTGNVRWWPVKATMVDFDALARDRDQLWAEAVAQYKAGVVPEPRTREEKVLLGEEVIDRVQADPWEKDFAAWLDGKNEITIAELLTDCLQIPTKNQEQRDQNRAVKVLCMLGFTQAPGRPKRDGKRVRLYVRSEPVTAPTEAELEEQTTYDNVHYLIQGK